MTACALQITGLHHTYPGEIHALRGVSFQIEAGESVGIIGANGAGKSTLLWHLNGLILPQHGTVTVCGETLNKASLTSVRRRVGMIFQDPDDQLFMPTVHDDVAFGPANLGLPPHEVEARVAQALETVGAAHLRDRPPYRLSGGEKRAAAIAGVLAMAPEILVMDEPTANLDPHARRQFIALLQSFPHTRIVATHDLDMVCDLCTRCIVMHEGQIKADGPTAEIFHNEDLLRECRLEKPLRMQACPACGGEKEVAV